MLVLLWSKVSTNTSRKVMNFFKQKQYTELWIARSEPNLYKCVFRLFIQRSLSELEPSLPHSKKSCHSTTQSTPFSSLTWRIELVFHWISFPKESYKHKGEQIKLTKSTKYFTFVSFWIESFRKKSRSRWLHRSFMTACANNTSFGNLHARAGREFMQKSEN